MKTKIKRYSRSVLSVLLSLCILMSCMAVGIIATEAASIGNIGYANIKGEMLANGEWSSSWITHPMSGDGNHYSVTLLLKAGYEYKFAVELGKQNDWNAQYGKSGAYFDQASETETGLVSGQEMKVKAISSSTGYVNAVFDFYGEFSNDSRLTVSQSQGSAPQPYLHYGSSDRSLHDNTATNVAMTHSSGDVYTYQLNAGTYYINIDGNSGQAGQALGISSVTANTGTSYSNFNSEWGQYHYVKISSAAKMDLSYNNSTKVLTLTAAASTVNTAVSPSGAGTAYISSGPTVGTATSASITYGSLAYLKATATNSRYEFSSWKTTSGLEYTTPGKPSTSAKVTANATATAIFLPVKYNITKQNTTHIKVNVPTEARWGTSVTPTATAEPGYKVSKFQYSQNGGTSWTDVAVGSSFTMPEHDVIVRAVETTCTTYTVTFSATGNGSISAVTDDGRTISSGGLVNSGSVVTFTAVPADEATFTSWGGNLSGSVSPATLTINGDKNVTATFGDNSYFVASYTSSSYDSGSTAYSSIAMTRLNNGYYRSSSTIANNKYFTVGKTSGGTTTYAKCGQDDPWGITTDVPAVTPQHWTSSSAMKSKYQNKLGGAKYVFYDPETDKIWLSSDPSGFTGVTIYAKDGSLVHPTPGTGTTPGTTCGWGNTTLTVTAGGSNKAVTNVFDSQVHKASLSESEVQASTTSVTVSTTVSKSGYYLYGYDVNGITIKANNGSATFCPADLDCNISNFIEITPIYMLTDPSLTDPSATPTTVRFYVRSFAGEIESRWGGTLYCYAYNSSEHTNGDWPGQPMVNLGGGTYYMDLPINTKAITLSNASADWVHATTMGIGLPTDNNQQAWDNRNAYQCQSYDYDDFQYIYAKPGVGENDEDIIFDFKYKQGEWGTSGKDNFNDKTGSSATSFPSSITPSSYTGWEKYTDFYGNPIDLWGNKLTSNYNNNPVRIVVQGYYDTTAANNSYYATTYVVYKPSSTTDSNPSYSRVDYTNSSDGYGKKSRSEFLQRSAEDMGLGELEGQPVLITYEYAIYAKDSTQGTHNTNNEYAERADGVWYYSETQPVKAKIKIQYSDKLYGTYTDDTFEIDTDNPGTDYDGDPYTVNEGTVTKGKAYFADNNYGGSNRPSGAPFNVDYTDRTVEFAYSDGSETYDLVAEESPDGEYTFVGWYKETSNGLDKCPPGFTYSMEATTNETFIARYVKAPSGIKLAHKPVVTNNSGGTGERKVKYEIYNNANLTGTPLKTGEANGSIVVDKKFIKYNQNYYLKVTYEADPDDNSLINGIYSTDTQETANLISEAGFEAHNTYNSKHVDISGFELTPSGAASENTTKVEFKVPINSFFKQITGTTDYEFDEDLALLELFSDFDKIRNNINITKSVDYNNGDSFTVTVQEQYLTDPSDPTTTAWRNYSGKYTVDDGTTETNFTGTISITGGQTIHIVDAPAGTVFKISEANVPTTYTYGGVTIDGATATDITQGKQFTMPATGSVDMEFTNTIKKAAVKIKKVVQDGSSGTTTFPITATIQVPGGTSQTVQNFNLEHNGEGSLGSLPVGTIISISEGNTAGYQLVGVTCDGTYVKTNASSFIVDAATSGSATGLITVTNRKLYQVTIAKNLTSSITNDPATFTFDYSYTDKDGTPKSGTSTAIGHNDTYDLPDLLPVGTQVTITENATAGYTNTGSTVTANITKNDNVYTVNGDGTITFNNSLDTKTIQLKKNVDVQYSTQPTFPVKVQYYADSQWNDFDTYDLPSDGTPVSVTLTGVAATAKINVVETSAGANYNSSLTSIQINSGAAVTGMSRDIDVPNADDIITINNYAIKKDVKISKTADYVAAGAFGFTFTEAADGYKYQKYESNGTATGSEVTIGSSTRTFTLTSGQYIVVKDLPVNKTFAVEETNEQGATSTTITYTGVSCIISGKQATFTVQNINTEQSVAFTNSQDKKLTIKKTIIDTDIVDTSTPFYISVTQGGIPFTGTRGSGYTINNANSSDTGERNTNGKFKLYPGEEIEITAQQGNIFTVVETDINNNYQFDSVLIDGTSSTTNDAKSITIGTTSVEVEYKNKIKRHNVTVSKNVTNYDSNYNVDFPITATITKPGKAATIQSGSIKHGGSFVISNLPMGTTVTVTETVPDGFTQGATVYGGGLNSSGVLETDADGTIQVNNTLNTKTINLQKAVVGWNNLPATTFPVTVQYLDNNSEWQDYTTVNLSTDGTAQSVVLKGVAATAHLNVIETISGANANYCDSTQTTIKVGSAEAQSGTAYAFNSPDNNTTVLITNYAKLVNVTVEKQVTNNNGDTTRFPITANITYPNSTTATATSADGKLADNENFVISNLPYGTTITVTETVPEGYTRGADTFTGVTVSSGTYTVGSTNGTITVNNTMKTKTLKIKKVVDFSYSNETTFPISVQYYNGTSYVDVPNAPTTISNSGEWATVTLNGVAAVSKIKVTETLPSNTHYDSTLTASSVANATKVDGESSGSSIVFTSTDSQSPEVTFNNYAKKIPVTVKKVITNFVTGDTTEFPITATYKRPGDDSATAVGPNSLANNGTFSVGTLPVGTEITVTENLSGISGYTQGATEFTNGLSEDSGTYTIKTDASGEQTITVNNRRDTAGFTIKKLTDVNNTADSFKIKIWTSPNGTDWTAYTSDIDSFTADANSEYTIHKNSELTVEGLMANTYIKVQETDGMSSKYTSAVTGFTGTTLETGSDNTTGIVKIGGTGQGINITNTTIKKDIIINKNVLHFANSTDAFNVNVLLNSEEAASKTYSYTGAATGTITNRTTNTGIELKNGETITIKDVPIGTTVTVTEQAPTGRYEFVDIDTANANVTTPATTSTRSETFVTNDTANNAVVTIKNDVKTHNVVITKSINNSDNSTATFKISATVQPLGASDTAQNSWDRQVGTGTRGTGSLTNMEITNGQFITIYGVPVDAKVTVTEGETANFTAVSVDGTAGSTANFIMPDTNRNVAVVNRINDKNVVVKKVVDGEASNTDTFPIKVEVKANTSGAEFVAYTGAGFDANGKILLAANNTTGATVTVPLDAEVKVTELTSDAQMPTGYTIDKITLNSGTTDVRTDNSYTYTAQADGTVTVHNKRVQGSIKVTKKISGDKYLDPDFAITVTYQRPADSEPQTQTFTVKGNGDSSGLFELPYGTVVSNVSEASVAGYKLVDTDPIQYKVNDGTAQAFGSGFTVTNQPVEIIVTNELTKHTVTIQKQVVDASDEPISDSTNFTVSYENGSAAAQTGTINKGNNTVVTVNNVPYGTTFTVEEINIPRGYELKSITGNGNVTVTGNTNITVTNTKLPTYSVKVTKNVDGTADATKFRVSVQTDGTPYTYAVNDGSPTAVSNGAATNVQLEDTEYVIVSGLLEGEKLTVTETYDGAPNYSFDKFTVNGADEAGTNKSYEYTVTTGNNQNIIVNNKEAAKYQYEVTYKYEGYSATTYNNDGTPKEGPQRSFKASGDLSAADWTGYFGADGDTFVTDAKAKEFFGKTAPYEDDFMMDMEFKPEKIKNMNVDRTNRKVTFEVTATTDPNRTVYVYFQLPYNVDANLVATGTQYNTTNQQHEATTQYGNWVKKNGSFVSAPLTLQGTDGTHYFQYWQIRSTTAESGRNKGKVETNYKKCFYADFNMTMYQDSYVTAVYTTDTTDYDPSTRSYQDTKDGEARINFIENSRNQWNSDGAPDLSGADKQKAGDRIYSDFLLTFGYQDLELNTLNTTNLKTGFVVEKVAELDTGTSGYETKTQSEYHQNYGSSEDDAMAKVEALVKANKTSDTGVTVKDGVTSSFIMNSNINLNQLDNKNQMKYSLNMKNKEYATNANPSDPYRNYVFRAYTYIKNGDKVVVSDPTYFTIYDMASIEPKG